MLRRHPHLKRDAVQRGLTPSSLARDAPQRCTQLRPPSAPLRCVLLHGFAASMPWPDLRRRVSALAPPLPVLLTSNNSGLQTMC